MDPNHSWGVQRGRKSSFTVIGDFSQEMMWCLAVTKEMGQYLSVVYTTPGATPYRTDYAPVISSAWLGRVGNAQGEWSHQPASRWCIPSWVWLVWQATLPVLVPHRLAEVQRCLLEPHYTAVKSLGPYYYPTKKALHAAAACL